MRFHSGYVLASCLVGITATTVAVVNAQPPRERGGQSTVTVESSVNRLMAYDADKDGKLSKSEVTDSRLLPLLQRCDANNDGIVTRDELMAQIGKETAASANSGPGAGPSGQRPGPETRGPAAPPGPGQILPPFVVEELKLNDQQRRQLQELQQEVDAKLAKILTPEQQDQLRQSRNRGPGSPGGPGRPGEGRPPRPQ